MTGSPRELASRTASRTVSPYKNLPSPIAKSVEASLDVLQGQQAEPVVGEEQFDTSTAGESIEPMLTLPYGDLRSLLEETAEVASRRILAEFVSTHGVLVGSELNLVNQPEVRGPGDAVERPASSSKRRSIGDSSQVVAGKRPANRYTLQPWMYRKHPTMSFFATGPIDSDKTPYKWLCRVCNQELSLMTKGAVEVMSHYRTETHLVKEHRIRLETPGLPLYDRHEHELKGVELQKAIEVARSTYPISPHLAEKRRLPGQLEIPAASKESTPSELALSQIRLFCHGLRHGGSLDLLHDLWEDLIQQSSDATQFPKHDWSPSRCLVSMFS